MATAESTHQQHCHHHAQSDLGQHQQQGQVDVEEGKGEEWLVGVGPAGGTAAGSKEGRVEVRY